MDRSRESVDDNRNHSRSNSASRSSLKDVSSNTKSKLSNLTNGLWKRNDSNNSQNLRVTIPKKEFSKSVEDCRKTRKNFLTKVKIPDIFVGQKDDSNLLDVKNKEAKSESLTSIKNTKNFRSSNIIKVNGKTVHESSRSRPNNRNLKNVSAKSELEQKKSQKNGEVKTEPFKNGEIRTESLKNGEIKSETSKNGSVKHESLKNGVTKRDDTVKNDSNRTRSDNCVPKPEINKQNKPRGKIASYLKLFENLDSGRIRDQQIERGSSLKITRNEINKEHITSDQVDTERFFSLGRFMRRKSSGGGKKIPEVTDRCTFVSHIPKDFENEKPENVAVNIISCNSCDSQSVDSSTDNIINNPCKILDREQVVPVLTDITGFNSVYDFRTETETASEPCAKNAWNYQEDEKKSSVEEKLKDPVDSMCMRNAIEEIQLGELIISFAKIAY